MIMFFYYYEESYLFSCIDDPQYKNIFPMVLLY